MDPPPEGTGGSGQCGAATHPADTATTTTADDNHDDRNNETEEPGPNTNTENKYIHINSDIEKQITNIIFNYSRIKLTEPMKRLLKFNLNRALNFAILPVKFDVTELLVDFNRYARAVIWHEYWHGKEEEGNN